MVNTLKATITVTKTVTQEIPIKIQFCRDSDNCITFETEEKTYHLALDFERKRFIEKYLTEKDC